MVKREGVTSWVGGTLRAGTLGGGGVRWWGGLLDVGYVEGIRWRGEGGGVSWGGGGGGCGVLQRRETLSLGPRPGKTAQKPLKNRSKTAQILLEKPFKNHRKK